MFLIIEQLRLLIFKIVKKTTSLIILLIGLCISTSVKAQDVEFGIKAGLNVTDMKLSSELFKND